MPEIYAKRKFACDKKMALSHCVAVGRLAVGNIFDFLAFEIHNDAPASLLQGNAIAGGAEVENLISVSTSLRRCIHALLTSM